MKIHEKGKRVVAGVIAVILAVTMASPIGITGIRVNAEEKPKEGSRVEIRNGELVSMEYMTSDAAETKKVSFNQGQESYDFDEENVTRVVIEYKTDTGYILNSVQQNGESLKSEQYSVEKKEENEKITYKAVGENKVGDIRICCIPKELEISDLEIRRVLDNAGTPTESIGLSWKAPVIPKGSDYSLEDYQVIIQEKEQGKESRILEKGAAVTENGAVCSFQYDGTTEKKAVSQTAIYSVSVVANPAEEEFMGKGTSREWSAVYDIVLSVNGNGKVKINGKEFTERDNPYIIYGIPGVAENETNLKVEVTPGENYGLSSLMVEKEEKMLGIAEEEYNVCITKSGNVSASFLPLTTKPDLTNSGHIYTEIAENGTVAVHSNETAENTSYGFKGMETYEFQPAWKELTRSFEGGNATIQISAEELFENNNYAVVKAYSTQADHANSKMAEQYYYRTPERPVETAVSFEHGVLNEWRAENVTLTYTKNSKREYQALQIGYSTNGGEITNWQDMTENDGEYSYTFDQTGEYTVGLRFKIYDPNNTGQYVVGDSLFFSNTVKLDKEIPELEVSGYENQQWVRNDVELTLNNRKKQISGTKYQYAVLDNSVVSESMDLNWQECVNGNQVTISCKEGETLTKYVYMRAVSNAGMKADVIFYIVHIDKKSPEMPKISLSEIDGDNGWYLSFPEITLQETEQDNGSEVFTYYKLYPAEQEVSTVPEILFTGENQPEIKQDGTYILKCYARDGAGNVTETAEEIIKIDTGMPNPPSITFKTENDSVLAHIINFISFGYFSNERVIAVIESSDSTSQVEKCGVWLTQDGKEGETIFYEGSKIEVELPENFKGTVSAYAMDCAGNHSATSTSDGIVYENLQAEITITADVDNNSWYSGDVNFHVITQDKDSGLRNVEYILNGETIYQKEFTDSSHSEPVYMEQKDIQASEEAGNSAGYTLQIKVTDNAGNKSEKSAVVYIDKTAPTIGFGGMEDGSYYNNTQTLKVYVNERIFESNQVSVSATRTIDGITIPYEMKGFISDAVNATQNYSFAEDGLYVVTVSAIDAAGNTAAPVQIAFTIDKTAPKISINGPQNESYHASDVSVEVSVQESFFENNTVTIDVTKMLDGKNGNVKFGVWENQGKNSSLKRSFGEDGTYLVSVNAKDAAGNEATVQQLTFTIDKTAPEVSIRGAGDYLITGNMVTLSYDVVESYFDTNDVSVQLQKEDIEGNVTDVDIGTWANSGKESSLSYQLKEDGIYTAIITAADKAGNKATARKTVTIDTSDPIIRYVDEINGKYYQVFRLPHELSEMISDLTVPDIGMYLNTDEYDGVSEVTEEGKYVFKLDVTDEVGHTAVAQAEFIVDNTPPKVIFYGIEDGAKYDRGVEWSISLKDAKDIIKEVIVDGERQKIDTEKNICQGMLRNIGTHTVQVKAVDLAGNVAEKTINVTITEETVLETLSRNKPLVVGGIAAVAGFTGAGAAYATGLLEKGLFKKRRMKK